jgi:GNAT superfamily N-acetyltransferase
MRPCARVVLVTRGGENRGNEPGFRRRTVTVLAVRAEELGPEWDAGAASLFAGALAVTFERSLERVRHWRRWQRPLFGVVADGALLGAAQLRAPDEANFEAAVIAVDRDHRGRGVGSSLWRRVRADVDVHKDHVMTVVRDDDQRSLAVVQHWGFAPFQHEVPGVLDLSGIDDPQAVPGVEVQVHEGFARLAADEELAKAFAASDTSPEAESGQVIEWSAMLRLAGDVDGLVAVARAADREVVGLAVAAAEADGSWLVMYTGVVPSHRGRGIARSLKEHLHQELASRDVRWVHTMNEVSNAAIRELNARLGYVPQPGAIRLRQRVAGDWSRP